MSSRAILKSLLTHMERLPPDATLQEFKEAMIAGCKSQAAIELEEPLVLNNNTNGPAIVVNNTNTVCHEGIWITDPAGRSVKVGVGLGSEGIVANEFIPRPEFSLPPVTVSERYSDIGNNGGSVTLTPNHPDPVPGVQPGPGWKSDTDHAQRIGSGYGGINEASGIPGDYGKHTGNLLGAGGIGEMFQAWRPHVTNSDYISFPWNGTMVHLPIGDFLPGGGGGGWPVFGGFKTFSDTPITAESGKWYDIDSSGGATTITLPGSPAQDDIVGVMDDGSFATTVGRNSKNIQHSAADFNPGSVVLYVFVYDGTDNWSLVGN